MRRLLVLRALRPDRIPAALKLMCERAMGPQYVNQEAFKVEEVMKVRGSRWGQGAGG